MQYFVSAGNDFSLPYQAMYVLVSVDSKEVWMKTRDLTGDETFVIYDDARVVKNYEYQLDDPKKYFGQDFIEYSSQYVKKETFRLGIYAIDPKALIMEVF